MAVMSMYPTRESRRHLQRLHHWENRRRRVLSHLNYQEWFERDGARAIGIATTTRTLCSCWMCTDRKPKHNQTKLKRSRVRKEVIASILAVEEGRLDYTIDWCVAHYEEYDPAVELWYARY